VKGCSPRQPTFSVRLTQPRTQLEYRCRERPVQTPQRATITEEDWNGTTYEQAHPDWLGVGEHAGRASGPSVFGLFFFQKPRGEGRVGVRREEQPSIRADSDQPGLHRRADRHSRFAGRVREQPGALGRDHLQAGARLFLGRHRLGGRPRCRPGPCERALITPASDGKRLIAVSSKCTKSEIIQLAIKHFPIVNASAKDEKQGWEGWDTIDGSALSRVLGIKYIPFEQSVVDFVGHMLAYKKQS
jgi:hypothetical protein